MELDPYSAGQQLVLEAIRSHPAVQDFVRGQNIIDVGGTDTTPQKDGHKTSDFPEIYLGPVGFAIAPNISTDSARVEVVWELRLMTNDWRVQEQLCPCLWALTKAIAGLKERRLASEIEGLATITVASGAIADNDPEASDATAGYMAVATITCHYLFGRASLTEGV